jgi:hypothetical protein
MSNSATLPARARCLLLATLTLSAAGTVTRAGDDAVFCERLKQIVDNTADDFATLAVDRIDDATWTPSVVLPGQEKCYVLRGKSINYICESEAIESKTKASAVAEQRLVQAEQCLGPRWQKLASLSEFFTSLNDDEGQRSFLVAVDKAISALDEYVVRIQIGRSHQQHLEAPPLTAEEMPSGAYCSELVKIVQSGVTHFSELIRGSTEEATGARKHWKSSTQLTGWEDCWVHEISNEKSCRYLSCSRGPFIDQPEASAHMEKVVGESRQCLGETWSIARSRQTDGTLNLRLLGPADQPYVEVRPSQSLYSSGWNVKLDVMLDTKGACGP